METVDDTETGGDDLSVEQAANAFAKANQTGIRKEQPGTENEDAGATEADDELQESGEDESDEAEGDSDDEEQPEDEDGAEPGSEGGRFVASNGNVKLPDGTVTTVAKLIDGNFRQADYTAKTTQLREKERQAEARISAVQASEQQVNQQREYLQQMLQAFMPKPPDPALVDQNSPSYDPLAYLSAKEQYEQVVGHINYVQQQSNLARQQAEQKNATARNEKAAKEWTTLQEKLPEVRNEAKLKTVLDDVQSAAAALGFTQEEIASAIPYDHRFVLALRKAAKWDRLQANKPKVVQQVQGRPPVQKGGKRLTPAAQKARHSQDAINRLKQTGSVEDAAAAFLASRKG